MKNINEAWGGIWNEDITRQHEYCIWRGVICNGEKRVLALELWNMKIQGALPSCHARLLKASVLPALCIPPLGALMPTRDHLFQARYPSRWET